MHHASPSKSSNNAATITNEGNIRKNKNLSLLIKKQLKK